MYIYLITNLINNKKYVGQTIKSNPYRRINQHFTWTEKCLKRYIINRATHKYGRENFKVDIIIKASSQKELDELEVKYIKEFNSLKPHGYNLALGGKGGIRLTSELYKEIGKKVSKTLKGRKFTKEHIDNLSKVRKGFTNNNRIQAHKKMIETRKLNNDFIKLKAIHIESGKEYIFDTIQDCANSLGLNSSNISRTYRGDQNRKQHKGYKFIKI